MLKALLLIAAILAQTAGDPPIVDNERVNVRERPTIGGPLGSIVRKTDNEIWIAVAANKVIVITLKDKKVAATNYISALPSKDKLADVLDKDWQGPVPYTLLIAPGGKVIYRHTGEVDPLELKRAIVDYIGRTY